MTLMTTRITLVEDEPEHAHELRKILRPKLGFEWGLICASAEEALERIPGAEQDVILMDVYMGGINGIECIWRLKEAGVGAPIIIYTALESDELVVEAIIAGASGYVLKHDPPDAVQTVVREVARGSFVLTRPVARDLRQFFHNVEPAVDPTARLSPRQHEALKEISLGYMDKEIIDHMKISLPTLRSHIREVFRKLEVQKRTEAAKIYCESRQGRFHRLAKLIKKMNKNRPPAP